MARVPRRLGPALALCGLAATVLGAAAAAIETSELRPDFRRATCGGVAFPIVGLTGPAGAESEESALYLRPAYLI